MIIIYFSGKGLLTKKVVRKRDTKPLESSKNKNEVFVANYAEKKKKIKEEH